MKVYIGPYNDDCSPREIKVEIHPYDSWSADHTLSYIILPVLKQLKATKHGSPPVDDVDVPDDLKSTSALPKVTSYDTDSNWHKRWEWVMDEMIWAFEHIAQDENLDFDPEIEQRVTRGTTLFGKYYRGLWD